MVQGHAWTTEQDEELRDGVEVGATLDEIADQLELPGEIVAARLLALELQITAED